MDTYQVFEGYGDVILVGYSKAGPTPTPTQYQRIGTTYMFTHGQCEPILSSRMQSCS